MNGKQAKRLRKKVYKELSKRQIGYRVDKDGSRHCTGLRAEYLQAKTKFKRREVKTGK